MGKAKAFELEKLVMGIMYTDSIGWKKAIQLLTMCYGKIDTISEEYVFSEFSTFYDNEMNGTVLKRFISFHKCVDPTDLAKIKINTNNIEERLADGRNRTVNLDPCLLSHGKFVMATTKCASFRLPLQEGIYADLSLVYARNQWIHFYWTYFDVKTKYVKKYLSEVRNQYLKQRKLLQQ